MSSRVLVKLYPLKLLISFIPVRSKEVEQIKFFFFIIQNPQDPMFLFLLLLFVSIAISWIIITFTDVCIQGELYR